jgi:hypothetical protein
MAVSHISQVSHLSQEVWQSEFSERIVDIERIERIIRALVRSRASGRIVEGVAVLGAISPFSKPSVARKTTQWVASCPPWLGSRTVEIAGPLSFYRFEIEAVGEQDGRVEARTPKAIEVVRSRRQVRIKPSARVTVARVTRSGTTEPRALADASRDGLSFVGTPDDVISRGEQLNVVIDWGERLRIQARLCVTHVSRPSATECLFGAMIEFAASEDAYHWYAEIDALVSPRVRTGGMWSRDIWDLFESSGYFTLSNKASEDFEQFRESFRAASRKLARAPELGTQVVWPSGRGVEASASVLALNHHAAFIYHLARRAGPTPPGVTGPEIMHALSAGTTHWLMAQEAMRWLVVWVQDTTKYSKRTHLDFVIRHANGVQASSVRFRALEIPVRKPANSEVRSRLEACSDDDEWTVRPARRSELARVAEAASAAYPPSFVQAHALALPEVDCMENWRASGLERGREIVVAERQGCIEAAATIEWAEDGVHVFGLFDVLRVIPMGASARATEEATAVLLDYARDRFARLDKPFFIFASDPALPVGEWAADAKDLGLTHCTVLSVALLPGLLDHLWEVITGAAH